MNEKLNLLFVFADQWRHRAFGYAGDPNVATPNIDRFAARSLNFTNAVSGCPVCSPNRASLMTGVYPHRHRVMVNDQCLCERYGGPFLAEALRDAGSRTAYIGSGPWTATGAKRTCRRTCRLPSWSGTSSSPSLAPPKQARLGRDDAAERLAWRPRRIHLDGKA